MTDFLNRYPLLAWLLIALFIVIFGLVVTWPVKAAVTDGCTQVGTVGNVIIAHCVDDQNGGAVWANSAGMLAVEP